MDTNTKYTEEIFEIYWEGPFSKKEFKRQVTKRKSAPKAWCLYAMCDDHPLYGRDALTYIGKAVEQPLADRVKQHDWWANEIYVASVFKFVSWPESQKAPYKNAIRDNSIISKIEELLIYSLSPAYNQRNKKTAKNSQKIRIFNTGQHGVMPTEVSGLYNIEHIPEPTLVDKE